MCRPVLIIGRGQLAQALLARDWTFPVAAVARPEFDFDRPATIAPVLAQIAPSVIVNTAAYTAVDRAETDAAAWRANRDGPRTIARFCAEHAVPFVHLSTDYVFAGTKGAPYVESDAPAPLNVYGASKLAGEQAALDTAEQVLVLRTAALISARGQNFVRRLLTSRDPGQPLRVVADQRASPTNTDDLAAGICEIAGQIARTGWRAEYRGVFHAAGSEAASWYALAQAVFAAAARYGVRAPMIVPISVAEWSAAARRPADSRLDSGRLAAVFGVHFASWRASLEKIVEQVLAETT